MGSAGVRAAFAYPLRGWRFDVCRTALFASGQLAADTPCAYAPPFPSRPQVLRGAQIIQTSSFRTLAHARLYAIAVLIPAALLGCSHSGPQHLAIVDPAGVPIGFSGLEAIDSVRFLVVVDRKDFQQGLRLASLRIEGATPDLTELSVSTWGGTPPLPSDLEGVCGIPQRTNEFFATESGSWEGRAGRLYRIQVAQTSAVVSDIEQLPVWADNTPDITGDQLEGLECAQLTASTVLLIFGERGGSAAHPSALLRWATYDLPTSTLTWTADGRTGKPVPGLLPQGGRNITGLYLDSNNDLWASGAVDPDQDFGPFWSLVYKVAVVDVDSNDPIQVIAAPAITHCVDGFKIEGLAAAPTTVAGAQLSFAGEDESFGGIFRALRSPGALAKSCS